MIDDCCGVGDLNESVICALLGFYPVVTATAAQADGSLPIVKKADGTCAQVSGVAFLETPWTGTTDTPSLLAITTGDNAAGPAGNAHAPVLTVLCEGVQDCVGPMLGDLTGFDYDDANNKWVTNGTVGQVATVNATGDLGWTDLPSTPAPTVGCGLTHNAGGDIIANVSGTWNWPCADTNGAPIYCDSAGQLRTVPDHTCVTSTRNGGGSGVAGPLGVGRYEGAAQSATINNPSLCRSMVWNAQYTFGTVVTGCDGSSGSPSLNAWGYGLSVTTSPGYAGHFEVGSETYGPLSGIPPISFAQTGMNSDAGVIAAGGSATVAAAAYFDIKGGAVALTLDFSATALIFGCTQ